MCKNPKKGYLFFNSTKCSHQKKKMKKKKRPIERTAKVNISSLSTYLPDFVTMQTHSKKSAFNRSRFYFEIILIAATPCCFFLFHCINKREVRPASLRSRSFRASSSKRLLSYTFIMYTGFDSTRHLHICKHTPTGSPSSIREFLKSSNGLEHKGFE